MIYFTADTHLNHKSMLKYGPRDHDSVGAMDEALIAAWNRTVGPSDTIYHLGDFTLSGQEVARKYFAQLNGIIKVVPGGHDYKWCKRHWMGLMGNYWSRSGIQVKILMPIHILKVDGAVIVLGHYSMRSWYKSHFGSFHLYGHSHGKLPPWPRSMDVGVDAVGYEPISLEKVLKRLNG